MQWHEFMYSLKPAKRLRRHLVFWAVWWVYFSACYFMYQQDPPSGVQPFYVKLGSYLLIKTFALVYVAAVACYTFIYFILPQILKGSLFTPSAGPLLLVGFLFSV